MHSNIRATSEVTSAAGCFREWVSKKPGMGRPEAPKRTSVQTQQEKGQLQRRCRYIMYHHAQYLVAGLCTGGAPLWT